MDTLATRETTEQLLEGLGAEHQCYEAFATLAEQQLRLIAEGETADLLRVLARKQQILEKIAGIETRLAPIKGRWEDLRRTLPEDVRRRIEQAIDKVGEQLGQVIQLERTSEEQLRSQKAATQAEIDRTNRGQKVQNAYGQPARGVGNRYLDTTDDGV